jgi:hypothetical protein
MELLPFLSLFVGIAGFAFAVWTHLSTRRVAEVRYQVSQFADYKMPAEFLKDVSRAPIKIHAVSTGNKSAENVAVRIKTKFPLVAYEFDPPELAPKVADNELRVEIGKLNPQQEFNLFLTCNGDPAIDQVEAVQITHAEGVALLMSLTKHAA